MPGKRLLKSIGVIALMVLAGTSSPAIAAIVFSDNFNRTNNTTIGNNWVESNPGSGDVAISGNLVDALSNNGGDTGNSYITQATSNFTSPWNNVLTSNSGLMTWTFNMRSNNADLGGFDASQEAIAVALAATGSDLNTANGYAVVWGQSTATDPIRLVSFSSGLDANANLTNVITASGASGTPGDPNSNYMSVKVTYDPASDTWELFARSDGASAFADPATGSYTSFGTAVNTAFTSLTITNVGLLGRYDGNNDERLFDNFSVDVQHAPEPAATSAIGLTVLTLLVRRRNVA